MHIVKLRCPGRPRNRWLDQLCRDNGTPLADLWRRARHTWDTRLGWRRRRLHVTH